MRMDNADFLQNRPVRTVSALVMLFLAWMLLPGSDCLAQKTPPFVVTTQSTITAYPPPPTTGTAPTPVVQGAGFGALAVNKYGDLFVGGYNSNTVVEFPASGMSSYNSATATVPYNVVYNSSTGGHAGAVAVDPNGNLIVSEVFSTVLTMIPYVNGAYTPFTNSAGGSPYSGGTYPTNPPVCTTATPTTVAACSYDYPLYYYAPGIMNLGGSTTNSPTGGYYQVASLAFDAAGNSFMATFGDSNGNTNIYECSVACNYAGAPPVQVFAFSDPATPTNKDQNYIDSIAVDANDNIFLANNSNTIWEVPGGASGTAPAIPLTTSFIDAQGVAFDQAGNLYVTDNGTSTSGGTINGGVWEIPLENGALNPADMFMIFPLDTVSYCAAKPPTTPPSTVPCSYPGYASPWNISEIGVAVDQHGNIFETVDYNTIYKYTVGNATLPATELGSATPGTATLSLTFNGSTPVTLQSSSVTAAGKPSAEFSIVTGANAGTCVIGAPATPNASGTSCTINIQFTPAQPGLRTAVLTLADSAGDAVPVNLSGVGVGQAITVDPGTLNAIGSGLKSPKAVTVDGAGNVFVADAGADAVYEYAQGAGTGVAVGSGLKAPAGVVTDAGGNLYISDTGNNRVVMVPNNGGVLSATESTLLNAKSPGQLAVDASGTLYIPEAGNNDVLAFAKPSGLLTSGLTTVMPIPNLTSPTSVAVDANYNLYVASKGNVVESADGVISDVGSNLNTPTSVAVDGSGSILIADGGSGRIWRVPNEHGVLTGSHETVVSSANSIQNPYAVQLDALGNLYATDSVNGAAYEVTRTSGAINFLPVNDTQSSAGQTAVLSSSGPEDLTLNSPLFAPLGANSSFNIPSSSDECTGLTALATGTSCTMEAYFAPGLGVAGEQTQTIAFSTGAENAASPSLVLSGVAVNELPATIALTQTLPVTGNASYGGSVTVQASVASKSGTGPTPTGQVQFTVDGNYFGSQTLDSTGAASIAIPGLSGGTHKVSASYLGDSIYAPESSSALTVTILPAASSTTISILGFAANPTTAEPPNSANTGDTVTMTATVVPSTPGALSGPVTFSSGATNLGTAYVTGTTSGTTDSTTTYTAVLTTTGATALAAGTYNIVATFGGNENYTSSASAPSPLIVTVPTFTITQTATTLTSSATSPGSMTLTLTSESGFTGSLDFSCSGLPAHATCQFIPDVLVLAQASSSPVVVPPLQTKLTVLINQAPVVTPTGIFWWSGLLLGLSLFGLASNRNARRRLLMQCMAGCLLLVSLAGLSGCGNTGSAAFVTPTGTSNVTVTVVATPPAAANASATSANNVTQKMTFKLTVQ